MTFSEKRFQQLLAQTQFSSSRSSGKGGQHVNKTSTKAELRFPICQSGIFSEDEIQRIRDKLGNRMNEEGILIITNESSRSLTMNRKKAEEIAYQLLTGALHIAKKRKPTKPSRAVKQKRMEQKRMLSEKKKRRRWDL